jgi:ribonuclease Z
MRITVLGTGTPILDSERQATSAIVVELGPEKILFDAGRGVTTQMMKQRIHPLTVDPVFITHHHYDHICDLGEFLMSIWHNGRTQPINILGPKGTSGIVDTLLNHVYARDIEFALFTEKDVIDIRQLVRVKDVSPGLIYETTRFKVFAEYMNHGNSLGLSESAWPCLGFRLESDGKAIALGGDTVACDGLYRIAKGADLLILSCYLADKEIKSPAFQKLAEHIIASSEQSGKIAHHAGAQKLLLTHFRKKSSELMLSLSDDVRADFQGELFLAKDGMMIEI